MTMLYRLDADAAAIARAFGLEVGEDPWAGGYVAPGSFAPVITAGREFIAGRGDGRQPRRMVPRLWGVPPPPSAPDAARPVLSVRNTDSPFWIGNLRNPEFRCIVPATAFMEWGASGPDGKRRQHWFTCADQPLFAFAAVWKDSEVPGFALLTSPPNAALKQAGRDAMPVILPPHRGAHELWLRAGWDRASALLEPYSSSLMQEAVR
ncbi:SOS response-associated peptidase family protein [Aurantiacibacter poecillastricola]|uniref:SOS response-associated peptidase family protein n=1 Tax=Aurantiacibacter poecillastricola TaxID=3064385 RepID=UPI00273F9A20|nr:SOS response-associated peptidase family protein [Aurantiacibacter sp. 219JJ12-13]MDP5263082.1 SOS response-associated peptidase family protein [Aurantiacibacter sp. 219JJ12-13]